MARIWRKAVAFAASALVAAGSAAAIPTVERSTTDARPTTENVNDNRPLFVELSKLHQALHYITMHLLIMY